MSRKRITERVLFDNAHSRARKKHIPFTIKLEDIYVPEYCPVLGLKLKTGWLRTRDCSPSLDRIRPSLGYVPGNVIVVSHKANSIKSDATPRELEQVAAFYRQLME